MSQFDAYDFVGYVVPGAVFVLFLMYVFPGLRAVFVVGQLLHQLSHVTRYYAPFDRDYPSNTIVPKRSQQTLLSADDRNRVLAAVKKNFGVDVCEDHFDPYGKDRDAWRDIVRRIYIDARAREINNGIDIFVRGEGLMRGLATAFGLLALLCVLLLILPRIRWVWLTRIVPRFSTNIAATSLLEAVKTGGILAILIVACVMSFCRMQYFKWDYSRELLLSYLPSPDSRACTRLSSTCECDP